MLTCTILTGLVLWPEVFFDKDVGVALLLLKESCYLEEQIEFFVSFDRTLNPYYLTPVFFAFWLCAPGFWLWHHLSPESALPPETFLKL